MISWTRSFSLIFFQDLLRHIKLSILPSQFIEKGFKKAENSEQNVVLLLFLFTEDIKCEFIVIRTSGQRLCVKYKIIMSSTQLH